MKTLLIVLFILCSCMVNAQSYKKFLSKYDVIDLLPEKSNGDAASFWTCVLDGNKELLSSMDKLLTKGGSAKETRERMHIAISNSNHLFDDDAIFNAHIDSMKYIILGNYPLVEKCNILYLKQNDINAFCTPDIDGSYLKVYVCDGLLNVLPIKSELGLPCFYAVLAHEFAHGLFLHAQIHLYKTIKKEKANNLFADIATGLAAYTNSYSKASGKESQIKDLGKYSQNIHNWAKRNTLLYQFKYGREQEFQADIIAFRLLDWLGIGGEAIITMLELTKSPFEYSDEYNDHPTTQERIELLRFISRQKRIKLE